ncbi:MAG: TIGR03557 family F420-dependent LLM class oxidoreductase [Thermoleophilia bacterium]|nr:TIGR03557 family F420-dependent LLM class oxidoreductase [Thermoleophilia bacterium]
MEFGYALSSEEHRPNDLVRNCRLAEEAGLTFALISDHYHPWVDAQGQSAFVWSVIGGIAHATERIRLGTGVTCPTIRIHPAIVAQAAATSAAMMPGRFFLGVGTGENLNEHILGDKWPVPDERLEMLEEAIEVIRLLWDGGYQTFRGDYYTVEQARLYTLPDEPPPIAVAASKPLAADVAAHSGDALISTAPDASLVQGYRDAGGDGPVYAQITCCWARTEEEGVRTVHETWPNAGLKGDLSQELALPLHFEQAVQLVTEDQIAGLVACGPDPRPFVEQVRKYAEAGFDHVYFHQIGRDQDGFFRFFREELAPALQRELAAA